MSNTGTMSRIDLRFSSKLPPCGFDAGDANLRRYVGNNPTNATDPTGLVEWDIDPTKHTIKMKVTIVLKWVDNGDDKWDEYRRAVLSATLL